MNERRADSITNQAEICLLAAGVLKSLKISKRRRHWAWEWILLRDERGADYSLVKELQLEDQKS